MKKVQRFSEGDKVKVANEVRFILGLNVITVRPGDVLLVIGYSNFGEVCARFDDCADTEALHDAFFGKFYLDATNVIAA